MRAIIRKERNRKMEHPPKESCFRVRSRPVDPEKIKRFKRDRGIGDDATMGDAGNPTPKPYAWHFLTTSAMSLETPSDVSCITPPPGVSEIEYRGPDPVFEDCLGHPVASKDLHLTHRLPSSGPHLSCHNPAYWRENISTPNQSPLNGSRLGSHSPVYWRLSRSPVRESDNTSSYSSSPYPGHQSLSSFIDKFLQPVAVSPAISDFGWFDAFVNYSDRSRSSSRATSGSSIANLVHGLMKWDDGHQVSDDCIERMITRFTGVSLDNPERFEGYRRHSALEVLEYYIYVQECHRTSLPSTSTNFSGSEFFRPTSPVPKLHTSYHMDLALRAAHLLLNGGQHKDAERVVEAIIQEMARQTCLDIVHKGYMTIELAEFYAVYERHERAEELTLDALKDNFRAISLMESDETFSKLSVKALSEEILTIERTGVADVTALLNDIRALFLGGRTAEMPLYLRALSVLSKLHSETETLEVAILEMIARRGAS